MSNSSMDHSSMDHANMDHGSMDHGNMDHGTPVYDTTGVDHGDHGDSGMDMDHSMKMYFHFSESATILFEDWKTTNWEEMLGSCVAIFIMAALYEGLKVLREYLLRRGGGSRDKVVITPSASNGLMNEDVSVRQVSEISVKRMLTLSHLIQSLLHIVQIVVSYFLMLIFMTYNVWLCIAVALGAGAGYFLFSWRREVVIDINEHCH